MPVDLQSISCTTKSLVESSGHLDLILSSLCTKPNCPQDLSSIQTECAAIKSALFFLYGAITLNHDVLLPLLSADSLLSRVCDWTLTSAVLSFARLEAETARLFKKPKTSDQIPWDHDLLKSMLLRTQAQHNALDAIHNSLSLHSGNMVLETLSQKEKLFETVRGTLPCVVRVPISIFSNTRRHRASLHEEVVTSLVYQRVLHQLNELGKESCGRPQVDSVESLTNAHSSRNIRPGHAGAHPVVTIQSRYEKPPAPTGSPSQEQTQRAIPGLEPVVPLPEVQGSSKPSAHVVPDANIGSQPEKHTTPCHSQFPDLWSDQQSQVSTYNISATPGSYFPPIAVDPANGSYAEISPTFSGVIYDPGDDDLPEVIPADWMEKIPVYPVSSPGLQAPEVAPSRSPKFKAPQSMAALRRHTFNLKKPSLSQNPVPPSIPGTRRRESSVSNVSGEGVWMHWFNDHVETFGEAEWLAPMQELYLTIPLVGDTAVQKNAAVERWLKQKSLAPPKFKKDEIAVEGMADDGDKQIPMKVTFTCVSKLKNMNKVQNIFIGEAVYAVCLFNIAEEKTLHSAINEWIPLLRRSSPSLDIILCGFGPGFGAIRPGNSGESIEELERISSEESTRSDQRTRPGYISFVSRLRGFTAARSVGASAYFECSELSCGDLDRFFSALIGHSAAARMERLMMDPGRRSISSFTPRGSTISANLMSS